MIHQEGPGATEVCFILFLLYFILKTKILAVGFNGFKPVYKYKYDCGF